MERSSSHILDGMTSAARAAVGKLSAFAARCLRYGSGIGRPDAVGAPAEACAAATEYQLLKDFVAAYSCAGSPTVLAFGDSVFLRVATDDPSQESLSELLCGYFGEQIFQVLGSGYHSGIYEGFTAVLAKLSARPSIVIMPVNLRVFSPTWDSNPLYQFPAEMGLLAAFRMDNPEYMLRDAGGESDAQYLSVSMECESGRPMTVGDFIDITRAQPVQGSAEWNARLECIFRHHYACQLDLENRKLRSLTRAVKLLNEIGVAIYCYITPINHEAGMEYCGPSFAGKVRDNISALRQGLETATASRHDMFRLDDFAFEFGRHAFFTPHNSTEHLRLDGRQFLARAIIDACRSVTAGGFSKRTAN